MRFGWFDLTEREWEEKITARPQSNKGAFGGGLRGGFSSKKKRKRKKRRRDEQR
jgi:hypothetical protein